jgi:hypothetical protein
MHYRALHVCIYNKVYMHYRPLYVYIICTMYMHYGPLYVCIICTVYVLYVNSILLWTLGILFSAANEMGQYTFRHALRKLQ